MNCHTTTHFIFWFVGSNCFTWNPSIALVPCQHPCYTNLPSPNPSVRAPLKPRGTVAYNFLGAFRQTLNGYCFKNQWCSNYYTLLPESAFNNQCLNFVLSPVFYLAQRARWNTERSWVIKALVQYSKKTWGSEGFGPKIHLMSISGNCGGGSAANHHHLTMQKWDSSNKQ